MSMSIKKGDAVKIIAGNDNGKTGTILAVDPENKKVVVSGEGITKAKHFVKPRNANEKGGIVEKEKFIDASNVMILCPVCNKATRVAHKIEKDENGKDKKVRICKHCGASLDDVNASKAKKATKTAAKKTTAKKATKTATAETEAPAEVKVSE